MEADDEQRVSLRRVSRRNDTNRRGRVAGVPGLATIYLDNIYFY